MINAAYIQDGKVVARFSGFTTVGKLLTKTVPEGCVLVTDSPHAGTFVAQVPALGEDCDV